MDSDKVTIDFDRIASTAEIGINRALVFMGLGVNCANDPSQCDFSLPEAGYLELVPETVPEATMREYKEEFGIWVISNGLRELVDTFNVFLDHVYSLALTVEAWSATQRGETAADEEELAKRHELFTWLGTAEKLARIGRGHGISTEFRPEIETVKQARDCLTHRLGVVGKQDTRTDDCLTLRWRTVELCGHHEDGSEFVASLDDLPTTFPRGSSVAIRTAPREKRVPLGDRLRLSVGELKEICFTFRLAVGQVRDSSLEFASRMGVEVSCADTGT